MNHRTLTLGIVGGLLLSSAFAFQLTRSGEDIAPGFTATPQVLWENIGNLTSSNAALAVTARDYSEVWTDLTDAKTIKWDVPNEASILELRFQTTADADATTVNMYLAAGATMRDGTTESQFLLGATLALTGGTQTGTTSNVFVDTIVSTDAVLSGSETLDSAANRVAVWRVDLRGYKKVVIIATTLEGSSTLYADARWY